MLTRIWGIAGLKHSIELEREPPGLPGFRTIITDSPWPERGGGKIRRGANRHYELLKVPQIAPTILQSGVFKPAKSCHLWEWYTNNYLKAAVTIMEEQLGFRYVTQKTWAKDHRGIGQYMAGQTEHCMLGVFGDTMMPKHKLLTTTLFGGGIVPVVRDDRGKIIHSKKPPITYEEIEKVSPAPRLEMFATEVRTGWWSWGHLLMKNSFAMKYELGLVHVDKNGVIKAWPAELCWGSA